MGWRLQNVESGRKTYRKYMKYIEDLGDRKTIIAGKVKVAEERWILKQAIRDEL